MDLSAAPLVARTLALWSIWNALWSWCRLAFVWCRSKAASAPFEWLVWLDTWRSLDLAVCIGPSGSDSESMILNWCPGAFECFQVGDKWILSWIREVPACLETVSCILCRKELLWLPFEFWCFAILWSVQHSGQIEIRGLIGKHSSCFTSFQIWFHLG